MQQQKTGTARAALGAAAVMLALTVWGRGAALALAGALVGPLPALYTALDCLRGSDDPQPAGSAPADPSPDGGDAAGSAPAADPTAIERYLVPLQTDAERPADAGAVIETFYGQGSGEQYIPCAAGIHTLHDETLNDYPSYTGSYAASRAVVQQYLAQYPSIKVVVDVHRDAIEDGAGARKAPVAEIGGRKAAQVMLICGCDNGSTVSLPNWRQNLRFAAAWQSAMESAYPGLTRPVLFSYRFYNQDLTTGSLLLEVGTHGNNLNEALYAGQLAARALAGLLRGSAGG